jgi:hypothetical protein
MNLTSSEIVIFVLTLVWAIPCAAMVRLYFRNPYENSACGFLAVVFGVLTLIFAVMSIISAHDIIEDYNREYTMTYKVHYCDGSSKTRTLVSERRITAQPTRCRRIVYTYETGQFIVDGQFEIVSYTYKQIR